MITNRQIYDIVTRIAVLCEGVKLGESAYFAGVIQNLKADIRAILKQNKSEKISDLTKVELTKLVLAISRKQDPVFAAYSSRLSKLMFDFMNADVVMTKRALSTLWIRDVDPEAEPLDAQEANDFFDTERENSKLTPLFGWASILQSLSFPALWAKINNGIIPANGMTPAQFVKAFTDSAQGAVLNAVRAAWANGETVDEAVARIVGNPSTNESGVLDRVVNQGRAVIDTIVQNTAQSVSAGVSSALLDEYRWDSVMDSKTSSICRSRNGQLYLFGDGPLPPAHINCRSHITPLNGSTDDTEPQTLYTWANSQSAAFQNAAFSGGRTYADIRPLTVEQFSQQTTVVLS